MKIGITGGNGFIGRMLINKHVDLGDEVHVLSRSGNNKLEEGYILHVGDLLNVNSLTSFVSSIDILYHCAAEINEVSKMDAVNIKGTRNLISKSSGKIKHWVQLSSVGVYGSIYEGTINEEQPYNPINKYEKTKLKSDLLVIEASKNKVFTCTIIRPSNVFGVNMKNKSLFELIKTVDKGLYFFIGNKGASANYIPVENVVESMYLSAYNPNAKNEIFIISNWCTIEDFIFNIAIYLEKTMPKIRIPIKLVKLIVAIIFFIPNNKLTKQRINALSNRAKFDTNKIENQLNYKPVKTIKQGIKELVQLYILKKQKK